MREVPDSGKGATGTAGHGGAAGRVHTNSSWNAPFPSSTFRDDRCRRASADGGAFLAVEESPEEVAHGVVGLGGVAQGHGRVDGVAVTAAHPGTGEVSGGLEIGDDELDGTFGDADARGDVTQPRIGIAGDL